MSVAVDVMSWESRASCRDAETGSFMPPLSGESVTERRSRELAAKRVCATCPVRGDCLDYALRVSEPFGIWGGLNEVERRDLASAPNERIEDKGGSAGQARVEAS